MLDTHPKQQVDQMRTQFFTLLKDAGLLPLFDHRTGTSHPPTHPPSHQVQQSSFQPPPSLLSFLVHKKASPPPTHPPTHLSTGAGRDYYNTNSGSWPVIKAALLAGLYPNVVRPLTHPTHPPTHLPTHLARHQSCSPRWPLPQCGTSHPPPTHPPTHPSRQKNISPTHPPIHLYRSEWTMGRRSLLSSPKQTVF